MVTSQLYPISFVVVVVVCIAEGCRHYGHRVESTIIILWLRQTTICYLVVVMLGIFIYHYVVSIL